MKSNCTGIKRILKAFNYSFEGLKAVCQTEAAFRQELLFCLICGIILFILPIPSISRVFLIFSLFLILFMELINTAIEVIIDRIGTDFNSLSKKAKDIGSLLVLAAFIHFFIAAGILLLPNLFGV